MADVDEERHQISVAEDYLWEDGRGGEGRRSGFGQVPPAHTGCPFILFFFFFQIQASKKPLHLAPEHFNQTASGDASLTPLDPPLLDR